MALNTLSDDELFSLLDNIDTNIDTDSNSVSKLFCVNCKSGDKITDDMTQGIVVCIGCGTVLDEIFDNTLETRNFEGDAVARCGAATNSFLPQSSLGTTMSGHGRNKVRLLHSWSAMPYKERSLHIVLKLIQSKCAQAGIMKCIEDDAKIMYKNISQIKHLFGKNSGKTVIIRGKRKLALIASCIFYACKKKGLSRSPKEIAKLFDLSYKDMTRGYKIFLKFVLKQTSVNYDANKITKPEDFIMRYCREIHIKNEFINQSIQIAKNIQKLDIASTHTPFSIATSSIILMIELNDFNIDRKYIAKKFGVSDVTINKTYKKIEKYKDILTNDTLCDSLAKKIEEERLKIKVPDKLKKIYENNKDKDKNKEEININNENNESLGKIINDDLKKELIRKVTLEEENYGNYDNESNNLPIYQKYQGGDFEEYIDCINSDLYDKLSCTDEIYESLFV